MLNDYNRWRGGSKPTVLIVITYAKLAELFNVSIPTIQRWARLKRLDPTNINDIIDKYNNRYKLDKRYKKPLEVEENATQTAENNLPEDATQGDERYAGGALMEFGVGYVV